MGEWSFRGYLPHYDDGAAIQLVTYRLADAMPRDVVAKLIERQEIARERFENLDVYLDNGYGSCCLQNDAVAKVVVQNWYHYHTRRYLLHAWVVMPNHVHVLVEPMGTHSLAAIVHGWKSYTAKCVLGSAGGSPASKSGAGRRPALPTETARKLWQRDYFDRYIRNETHYRAAIAYVHNNPVAANLVAAPEKWKWSSVNRTNDFDIAR